MRLSCLCSFKWSQYVRNVDGQPAFHSRTVQHKSSTQQNGDRSDEPDTRQHVQRLAIFRIKLALIYSIIEYNTHYIISTIDNP